MSTKEQSLGRKPAQTNRHQQQQQNEHHSRHINSTYVYELYPFDNMGQKYLVDGFGFYVSGNRNAAAPMIPYRELADAGSCTVLNTNNNSVKETEAAVAATSPAPSLPMPFGSFGEFAAQNAIEQRKAKKEAGRRARRSCGENAPAASPPQPPPHQTLSTSAATTSTTTTTSSASLLIPPGYKHIVHLMQEHAAVLSRMDDIQQALIVEKARHAEARARWEAAMAEDHHHHQQQTREGSGMIVGDGDDNDESAKASSAAAFALLHSPLPRPHGALICGEEVSGAESLCPSSSSSPQQRLAALLEEANEIAVLISHHSTTLRQYRRLKTFLLKSLRIELRTYGGAPCPTLRRHLWSFFSGSPFADPRQRAACSAIYARLVSTPIKAEHSDVIARDLGRTFPTHCLFQDSAAAGQTALRRILHAYCALDEELGYCQGMGFIVAVLLLSNSEEESFWILAQMLHGRSFGMRQLYITGFPLLQKFFVIFRQLLKRLLPKLNDHFDAQCVDVHFYGSQWFLTLFAYQFPIAAVCRIWDLFFSEGWIIIFKVSIAMLEWHQHQLMLLKMENILPLLKSIHEDKTVDAILKRALDVPITTRDLNECLLRDVAGGGGGGSDDDDDESA